MTKKILFQKLVFIATTIFFPLNFLFAQPNKNDTPVVQFNQRNRQIDVLFDGHFFTSYCYSDSLTKPILFPVCSPSGIIVNRMFPLQNIAGESTDHPHHTGIFFSCDEVNGNNFWNATSSPPQIRHSEVTRISTEANCGILSTISYWNDKENKPLLRENRTMKFSAAQTESFIDFEIILTALDQTVVFKDTKEGMFAIRVADWFKENGGTGRFISSNDDSTEKGVWGKRARWVTLSGEKDGKKIGVVICHAPQSVNYPTFWHVRGYGLFSANPLGQYIFENSLGISDPAFYNYTLAPGQSGLFKFRFAVYEGKRIKSQIEQLLQSF